MHIHYSRKIEKYFSDYDELKKELELSLVKIVKKRIDALKAANNFYIYLQTGLGKPHPLKGNNQGKYGIHIDGNKRLVVVVESSDLSIKGLQMCDSVTIEGVVDYHGEKESWIIP